MRKAPLVLAVILAACSSKPAAHDDAGAVTRAPDPPAARPAPPPPPPTPGPDPDGDDDPSDTGTGPFPERARFEKVGKPPLSLRRICDLTPFAGALYAAHAIIPLDMDGATITRYDPHAAQPFSVAFDWNRKGEPAARGGAGQGFLRVHAIGGRLFVPDADSPYNGFEITEPGTESYIFVSDANGTFAPAKMPHHKLPDEPTATRAGAGILPRAYHVLDVIRFRGRLYASTGSVPPKERAWRGPAPGALHVANEDMSRWNYEVDYPYPWRDGVWRLSYLVRFKGRLYAGLQDFDGADPTDFVVFEPPFGSNTISRADVKPVRATDRGGHRTLRWYVDPDDGKLYWIAQNLEGTKLRVTEDGNTWKSITFPKNAGAPTDVTRFRGVLVALTERGLYRLDRDPPAQVAKAPSPDGRTPFEWHDLFCAAPLAVLENVLYAGSQRDGALWRVVEGP